MAVKKKTTPPTATPLFAFGQIRSTSPPVTKPSTSPAISITAPTMLKIISGDPRGVLQPHHRLAPDRLLRALDHPLCRDGVVEGGERLGTQPQAVHQEVT